jgi:CheY-like chemotaxis protein
MICAIHRCLKSMLSHAAADWPVEGVVGRIPVQVRALLSLAVGRAGLASVQVEDGLQAIEMLADLSPSVVLLDVKMPASVGSKSAGGSVGNGTSRTFR